MRYKKTGEHVTFVEQHASLGGHMFRNVEAISSECRQAGIPYKMIVEKQLKTREKVVKFLTPFRDIFQMTPSRQNKCRQAEYETIIKETPVGFIFFMELSQIDFRVWPRILNKSSIQSHLKKNDLKIIIHISNYNLPLDELGHSLKNALPKLRSHLFFSLFSEIQVPIVQEEMPGANILYLHHPSYDSFYRNAFKLDDSLKTHLGYLGCFMERKRPDLVLSGLKYIKYAPFIVHMYPFKETHRDLFIELEKINPESGIFLTTPLSQSEYQYVLSRIKTALIPYDSYEYAVKASGVLEENMLSGTPVVIPDETWLSFFLKKHQGLGFIFRENVENSFETTLCQAAGTRLSALKKRQDISQTVYAELSMEAFLKKLNTLQSHPFFQNNTLPADAHKPVLKGRTFYHTLIAESKISQEEWTSAEHHLKTALKSDALYWKTHILCHQLPKSIQSRMTFLSKEEIIRQHLFYNPYDQNRYASVARPPSIQLPSTFLPPGNSKATPPENQKLKRLARRKDSLFAYHFALYSANQNKKQECLNWLKSAMTNLDLMTNEWQQDVLKFKCKVLSLKIRQQPVELPFFEAIIQKDTYQTVGKYFHFSEIFREAGYISEAIRLLGKALSLKDSKNEQIWRVHHRLSELYEKTSPDKHSIHQNKAIELLISKNIKSPDEHYSLASLHKKNRNLEFALKEFKKILLQKDTHGMQAGIYFHIGEIYFWKEKWTLAYQHLTNCLNLNPSHTKARQYLSNINPTLEKNLTHENVSP